MRIADKAANDSSNWCQAIQLHEAANGKVEIARTFSNLTFRSGRVGYDTMCKTQQNNKTKQTKNQIKIKQKTKQKTN